MIRHIVLLTDDGLKDVPTCLGISPKTCKFQHIIYLYCFTLELNFFFILNYAVGNRKYASLNNEAITRLASIRRYYNMRKMSPLLFYKQDFLGNLNTFLLSITLLKRKEKIITKM